MPLRPKMVGWFDPPRLVAIAIRVAISTVFGEFADRRETLAMSRPMDPLQLDPAHDYSQDAGAGDFWLDFMADTGDGWNPTYAIARLLAEPSLAIEGASEPLERGRILVMGGDQVYPTASRDAYRERLVDPLDEAACGKFDEADPPHLYAVPGNHDWYDGLLAFLGLFCRRRTDDAWSHARAGRMVGGRATQQMRSYFALKLPNGWWLWGADIQLSGYIDQPQIDFFTRVAEEWMEPGSRLILCTGQPSWAYADEKDPDPFFKNFSYLASLADHAKKAHRLCAVLTGDSHHYARFMEADCNYITAGGGGAFLHPTHNLHDRTFNWPYPRPGIGAEAGKTYVREFALVRDAATGRPSTFPDQATSRILAWRNVAFAAINWQYTATLIAYCVFFTWIMQSQAAYTGTTLQTALGSQAVSVWQAVVSYLGLAMLSPWPTALAAASMGGYYYLADFLSWRRLAVGVFHGALHAAILALSACVLARWLPALPAAGFVVAVGSIAGMLSATTLGIYLLICVNLFGKHWNEAFSALRIEDYKCFLRLRITPDGTLKIYPIGLKHVPREPREGTLRNPQLEPSLIEGPIEIR